jgi:hypothetical protein
VILPFHLPNQQTFSCPELIHAITDSPDWLDVLANPDQPNQAGLEDHLQQLRLVSNCLEESPNLTDNQESAADLISYFRFFYAGDNYSGDSLLELVDPATSTDPALKLLREDAGIPPPEGYFFVRYLRSRDDLPEVLTPTLADPQVAGVTYYYRYIAIPALDAQRWEQNLTRSRHIRRTLSHELVHAYLNSTAGSLDPAVLPEWVHEGAAIYLSGSGESNLVHTDRGDLVLLSTEEYRQYENNFRFLEEKLGREQLLNSLGEAVQTHQPDLLFRQAGFSNLESFSLAAQAWAAQAIRQQRIGLSLAFLAGLSIFIFAIFVLPGLLQPRLVCPHCGLDARASRFKVGYYGPRCPRCHRFLSIQG